MDIKRANVVLVVLALLGGLLALGLTVLGPRFLFRDTEPACASCGKNTSMLAQIDVLSPACKNRLAVIEELGARPQWTAVEAAAIRSFLTDDETSLARDETPIVRHAAMNQIGRRLSSGAITPKDARALREVLIPFLDHPLPATRGAAVAALKQAGEMRDPIVREKVRSLLSGDDKRLRRLARAALGE